MNLWNKLRDVFRKPQTPAAPPAGPTLRNKPGGMAWIKGVRPDFGAEQINGQVVKTVSLNRVGNWVVEPSPEFVATRRVKIESEGLNAAKGSNVGVAALADDLLEPIREVGDGEQDQSKAWLPPVPTITKEPA